VDRHPDAERTDLAPVGVAQGALAVERRGDRVDGVGEDRDQPVAGGLDHGSSAALDDRPEQRVVEGERSGHRRRPLLPQPGAALDVGDQE
jgi:hypothetical protein